MPAPFGHEAYNKNGEGGRPPKYTKEFIEKEADEFEKWMQKPGSIYFKRFAFDRGYSYNRMLEFSQDNERFAGVLKRAREWQEIRLAEGGLKEEFNGGFCKFVMSNTCGWSEKQQVSNETTDAIGNILGEIDGTSKNLVR